MSTRPNNNIAATGLTTVIRAIFNPLTIISVFGPMAVNIAMKQLRLHLNDLPTTSPYIGLKNIIQNDWGDALIDFHIQYTVLLMALILAVAGVLSITFGRIWKYPLDQITDKITKDWKALVLILVSIVLVAWLFISFVMGNLSSPEIIEMYKLNAIKYKGQTGAFHFPPWTSPITIWRIIISIYGFMAALIFEKVLNNLFPSRVSP